MKTSKSMWQSRTSQKLIWSLTLFAAFGTSCAFNGNSKNRNDAAQKEIEDLQEQASERCRTVEGFYTGTITTASRSFPAEVGVYCHPVELPNQSQKDPTGEPVLIDVPFMILTRTDVAQRQRFRLSYQTSTGSLSSVGAAVNLNEGYEDTILGSAYKLLFKSFKGQFEGSTISGNVIADVPFGMLNVQKDFSKGFTLNDDQVSFETTVKSFVKKMSQFQGQYCGYFKVRPGSPRPSFAVSMTSMVTEPSGLLYKLKGYFKVIEGASEGTLDLPTRFFFDFDGDQPRMIVDSLPKYAGSYHFSMKGTFDGLTYSGIYQEDIGTTADFFMYKMDYTSEKPPSKCISDAKKKLGVK